MLSLGRECLNLLKFLGLCAKVQEVLFGGVGNPLLPSQLESVPETT